MSEVLVKTRLQLTDIAVGVPSNEAQAQGAELQIEATFKLGLALPFLNSQTQEPIVTPLGELTVIFDKEQALAYSELIVEAAGHLPDAKKKSGLVVANNLGQVEKAAAEINRISGRSS